MSSYNRSAAVRYALNYVKKTCDCGTSYTNDCAHFISHCLNSGGLSTREGNIDPVYLGKCGVIVNVIKLHQWLLSSGHGKMINRDDLMSGDLLFIANDSHVVIFVGEYNGIKSCASHTKTGIFPLTHYLSGDCMRIQ